MTFAFLILHEFKQNLSLLCKECIVHAMITELRWQDITFQTSNISFTTSKGALPLAKPTTPDLHAEGPGIKYRVPAYFEPFHTRKPCNQGKEIMEDCRSTLPIGYKQT